MLSSLLSLSTTWVQLASRDTKQFVYLSNSDHSASDFQFLWQQGPVTCAPLEPQAARFFPVLLVNCCCAPLHVVLHMNALTVVLKWKIYYEVCSSNLQIDVSSLRMKHHYINGKHSCDFCLGRNKDLCSAVPELCAFSHLSWWLYTISPPSVPPAAALCL